MSMKNSSDTIGNRKLRLVAQCLNQKRNQQRTPFITHADLYTGDAVQTVLTERAGACGRGEKSSIDGKNASDGSCRQDTDWAVTSVYVLFNDAFGSLS
jgi:hypothetical protein